MDPVVTSLATVIAALVLVAASCGRVVAEHERAVVTRLGRPRRVAGPGVVLHLPLFEQVRVVSLRHQHLPLLTSAVTRDGVIVRTTGTVVLRVVDPTRVTVAQPDHLSATADEIESGIARALSGLRVVDLLPAREGLEPSITEEVNVRAAAWGTEVVLLELADFEARLTAELLHSARRTAGGGP